MKRSIPRLFVCSCLISTALSSPIQAVKETHVLQTMAKNSLYAEKWAGAILHFYGIDVSVDFPKPQYLAEVESPKWGRAIALIIAGILMYRYSKKVGLYLIRLGMSYLGYEYYDFICDYIKEKFNVCFEEIAPREGN